MYNAAARASIGGALLMAVLSPSAFANDNNAHIEGIVVGTYQAASESRVDGQSVNNEGNGQLYLFGTLDMGPGTWNLEMRGSTTPRDQGVTTFYGSNALVGETTDSDGDGRLAVTQLFYELSFGPGQLRGGLLDPTALLDGNEVAADEYTQFMADAFVHNPTIGFPSFVLGGAYQGDVNRRLSYKVFAGSDSGLEDGDHTYHNVFDVDGERDGHSKGAFTTAELNWHANGYLLQGGIWYDTGDVDSLDSTGNTNGYGFYVSAGAPVAAGRVLARAGIANDDAQAAANFLSLAYQLPLQFASRETTLGVAVARTGDSSNLTFDSAPVYQAEAYWRINVVGSFYVSPDVQYIKNAGFDKSHDDVLIGGVRVGATF